MRSRLLPLLLALASVVGGAAAAREAPVVGRPATPSPAAPASALAGSGWWLVEYERDGTTTPVTGRYSLRFDDNGAFQAGVCNALYGEVTYGDGWLEFAREVRSTQMMCHGEGAAVQAAFHAAAQSRVETVVDEPRLALRGANGVTLHYERGPAYGA